jgi:hypothetical protein
MHPLKASLRRLHEIGGKGVPETPGYPALSDMLNAVGEALKPKIHRIVNPANRRA